MPESKHFENIYVYAMDDLKESMTAVGILDTYSSLIWHTVYSGTGDFEIYTSAAYRDLLQRGRYIRIDGEEDVALIESVVSTSSIEEGDMITVTGRMATCLLSRRVIYTKNAFKVYPQYLSGEVMTAIRKLVTDNAFAPADDVRVIPIIGGISLANDDHQIIVDEDGKAATRQVTYDNLLTYIESLLTEYGYGHRMILEPTIIYGRYRLIYRVYRGDDRQITFSKEFDTLLSSTYTEDETDYANVALIAGEGEGLDRLNVITGKESGYDRREIYVDGSGISQTYEDDEGNEHLYNDVVYAVMLGQEGKTQLAALPVTVTMDGEVRTDRLVLGQDYRLGDIITILDQGKYIRVRVQEATEVQDTNGYQIDIVYGA